MNKAAKYGIYAAAGTGLALGAWWLYRTWRDAADMELRLQAKVDWNHITVSSIPILLRAFITNPTRSTLKFTYPFVKLVYKDTTIGMSGVREELVEIPSMKAAEITKDNTGKIIPIRIEMFFLRLGSLAVDLFNKVQGKQEAITIKAITSTYLVTPAGRQRIEFTEDITI